MYKIIRYEKIFNDKDELIGVFVSVRLLTGYVKEYFLNEEEVALVSEKENNLIDILENLCARTEKDLSDIQLSATYQIIETEGKKDSFTLSPQKVIEKKQQLIEEQLLEEQQQLLKEQQLKEIEII